MNTPTLILLPGLDGEGLFFEKLIAELPASIRAQRLTYPKTPMTYDALADWVLEQIDTSKPFFLLGESFGGPLAMRLATRKPPQLKGLILICTFSEPPPAWLARWIARLYPWAIRRSFADRLINFLLFNGSDMHRAQEILAALRRTPDDAIATRLLDVANASHSQFLQECKLPLLILNAARDRIVWRNYPRLLILACRTLTLITCNTPHALLEYMPKSAAITIAQFIQRTTLSAIK